MARRKRTKKKATGLEAITKDGTVIKIKMPSKRNTIKITKGIPKDSKLWLRTSKDVAEYRESNTPEVCPILEIKTKRWTLDHDHFDGHVRGVISQQANTLEGYILKAFMKYCSAYTDLPLSEVLRNMADYLETDYWLTKPLHYKVVEDQTKFLTRCTKEKIVERAQIDLGLTLNENDSKSDLVNAYIERFIQQMEEGNAK